MVCLKVPKRVDPKTSHHKEKTFFFLFVYIHMRRWMLTKLTVKVISQYAEVQLSYCPSKTYTVLYLNDFTMKLGAGGMK